MTEVNQALKDANALELAPGTVHENLEGWIPELASDAELRDALEKAFDYRGDITLTLKSGERFDAYIFDRKSGATLATSLVKYFPVNANEKKSVPYSEIARLEFTGKDRAAGKHWEAWVKQYQEKKASGEKGFGLQPETLD
jgi:transcriptional antiterminator Rof (Rho-off)